MIQEDTNDERNQLAIIQAFEFCYGQYLDNIIRYMKIEYSNKYVDGMMTKDIINFLCSTL